MLITEKSTPAQKEQFSLLKIIFALFSLIMLRLFLENFAYPDSLGYFFPLERFLHATIYFYSLFLSLSLLLYFFTKSSFEIIFSFMIKIFLFILTVPVIDALFNMITSKALMAYLIISPDKYLTSFFELLNPLSKQGVTFGQYFAAYGILLFMAFFVYKKNKRIASALLLLLTGYAILFIYEIFPSFIILFNDQKVSAGQSQLSIYHNILNRSWFPRYTEGFNFLNKVLFQTELAHEINMAKVYFISLTLQIGVIFLITKHGIWLALKKELRLERVFYWFVIASIGIFVNYKMFGDLNLKNPVNLISLTVFFLLILINIWIAVFVNDAEDIEIDKISNPTRPLASSKVSLHDWNIMQILLVLIAVIGMATLNKPVIYLLALTQASYYIYSARPLRLKRHFITSSILSGLGAVAIAMAGFFLVSPDQHFLAFPIKAMLFIGIFYGLISNFKDIKDFEGDKYEKIKTIPVVFGLQASKYIIATLFAIVFVAIPFVLKISAMIIPSFCIAIFLGYLFTKKEYREKHIFLVFFLYMLTLFLAVY